MLNANYLHAFLYYRDVIRIGKNLLNHHRQRRIHNLIAAMCIQLVCLLLSSRPSVHQFIEMVGMDERVIKCKLVFST